MNPFNNKQLNYRSYSTTLKAFSGKPVTQTSTALILTLITIAFFGFAAIRPTLSTISELQADIKEKEVTLEKIKTKLAALNTLQREIQANQDVYINFEQAVPDSQEINQTLAKVEILALENQLLLENVRVSPVAIYGEVDEDLLEITEDSSFPSFTVEISTTSSYDQLISFISNIDTIERYGKIESINFREPADEELEGLLTLNTKVRFYWNQLEDEKERPSR